jgi:predicted O-methyltransferase YrrM
MAMLAGMKLDVFTPLKDGPLTAKTLADVIGVDPTRLSLLLYALVTAELLKVTDGMFANTEVSDHYLAHGRESYVGDLHETYSRLWGVLPGTADSIRFGAPQSKQDFAAESKQELSALFRQFNPGAMDTGKLLCDLFNFDRFRHLLDVAGGGGGVSIAACTICPYLHATVVDLPSVIPITRELVSEAGMLDRITMVAADICDRPPEGTFDVAVLRNFIQVLSSDSARRALHNVSQALESGGVIIIWGRVLDNSRVTPIESVLQNLVFLNQYDKGQSYTEHEYRDWLTESGFVDIQRKQQSGGHSVIIARKT